MNVLDLFSGIGGFSLGLEMASDEFKTVAFCEIAEYPRKVLQKNWPNAKVYTDVKEITKERLASDGIRKIDVVCGGFPCQDISLAGTGSGLEGERSGLWFEMLRIIREVRPDFVIIENVAALRTRGLETVLQGLAESGYDAIWETIPACAVGALHRRDRLWIIAYANHEEQYALPLDAEMEWPSQFLADTPLLAQREPSDEAYALPDFWEARDESVNGCADVSNSNGSGCVEQRGAVSVLTQQPLPECYDWWEVEPPVGRVADGFPGRVDQLKGLGNAVVPQVVAAIGWSIINARD